jgi:hypothetical protein
MTDAKQPDNGTESFVTDSLGRTLGLKTMGPAGMLDLIEAAGDQSGNPSWVRSAMIIAAVASIDAVPIPVAVTKDQVKANARRLGNEGFAAVAKVLFGEDDAGEAGQVAAAKN